MSLLLLVSFKDCCLKIIGLKKYVSQLMGDWIGHSALNGDRAVWESSFVALLLGAGLLFKAGQSCAALRG